MKEGKSPGDVIFVCNELEYTVMRIDILSVVPELLESPLSHSIIKRARDKGIVEIHIHNIRDWSKDKFRKVDDYPFGGEAGLVMMIQPVYDCIMELTAQRHYDHCADPQPLRRLPPQVAGTVTDDMKSHASLLRPRRRPL